MSEQAVTIGDWQLDESGQWEREDSNEELRAYAWSFETTIGWTVWDDRGRGIRSDHANPPADLENAKHQADQALLYWTTS